MPPEPPASRWFTVPAPIRRLFELFPLHVYPHNELPTRSPSDRKLPSLFVFANEQEVARGLPSFNPSCLKWQTYLKIRGVEVELVSSNNHASPSGSLPFLLPAAGDPKAQIPVAGGKLYSWAAEHGSEKVEEVSSLKSEAYQSLLDHRIRNAWLYSLYLSPQNSPLLQRLYISPVSNSLVVHRTLLHQVCHAAEAEILKSARTAFVDPHSLYKDASEAFEALAALLGDDDWFFGSKGPTLFDAAVFSYTHLVLDENLEWKDGRLGEIVGKLPGLARHRGRILDSYWTSGTSVL